MREIKCYGIYVSFKTRPTSFVHLFFVIRSEVPFCYLPIPVSVNTPPWHTAMANGIMLDAKLQEWRWWTMMMMMLSIVPTREHRTTALRIGKRDTPTYAWPKRRQLRYNIIIVVRLFPTVFSLVPVDENVTRKVFSRFANGFDENARSNYTFDGCFVYGVRLRSACLPPSPRNRARQTQ